MMKKIILVSIGVMLLSICAGCADAQNGEKDTQEVMNNVSDSGSNMLSYAEFEGLKLKSPFDKAKLYTKEEVIDTQYSYAHVGLDRYGHIWLGDLCSDIEGKLELYPTLPVDINNDQKETYEECSLLAYKDGSDKKTDFKSGIGNIKLDQADSIYYLGGAQLANIREYESFSYFIDIEGIRYLVIEEKTTYNYVDYNYKNVINCGLTDDSYYTNYSVHIRDLNKKKEHGFEERYFEQSNYYTPDGICAGVYLGAGKPNEETVTFVELNEKYKDASNYSNYTSGKSDCKSYEDFFVAVNSFFKDFGLDDFIQWINRDQSECNVICGVRYIPENKQFVCPEESEEIFSINVFDTVNVQVFYCFNNGSNLMSLNETKEKEEEHRAENYTARDDKIRALYGMWKLRNESEYYYFNYLGELHGFRLNDDNETITSNYWLWRMDDEGYLGIGTKGDEDIYSEFNVSDNELCYYDKRENAIYLDRVSDIYTQEYAPLIGSWVSNENPDVVIEINNDFTYDVKGGTVGKDLHGGSYGNYCIFDGYFCSSDNGIGIVVKKYEIEENILVIGTSTFTKERN